MKKLELEKLEKVNFKIDHDAFAPKELTCPACKIKMKRAEIEVSLDYNIFIRLHGFECNKCKKRMLGLEESRKLDKAMILSRLLKKDFKMERSLSFDGDNWTFRIPKEFTAKVTERKIEIVPLGAKEFCATIK